MKANIKSFSLKILVAIMFFVLSFAVVLGMPVKSANASSTTGIDGIADDYDDLLLEIENAADGDTIVLMDRIYTPDNQ